MPVVREYLDFHQQQAIQSKLPSNASVKIERGQWELTLRSLTLQEVESICEFVKEKM